MDFKPDEEHELIREAIRTVCADFPDEYWSQCDLDHRFPTEFYDALAKGGWIGIAMPEEYGGGGRGIAEGAVVLEEIAASGAAFNGCSAIHMSMFGMHPMVRYGSDEIKKKYLPRVAAGQLHVAFGITEPTAGTDTSRIITKATLEGDHYIVNGTKVWTSKALESDKVLLLVRTTPKDQVERKMDGMTLLFADLKAPEVTIRPIPKYGRNAVASCETIYDDLPVHVSDRVGEEGRGFYHLLAGLNAERVLVAAGALGTGRAALRRGVDYANNRIVFDRPIGQNQGIAFPMAEAHARLEAASLMISKAAWKLDQKMDCGEESNLAKWLAADAAYMAADAAVQTHGGYGYACEYHVGRYFSEARLAKLGPVPQEMVMNYIAEHVLGLPRSY